MFTAADHGPAMTTTAALVTLATERPLPVRVVEVNRDSGFDWEDAGIGAVGAMALMVIVWGAALARQAVVAANKGGRR
jgi:hypothetical protein